jgi:hypothetical protein
MVVDKIGSVGVFGDCCVVEMTETISSDLMPLMVLCALITPGL